MSVLDTKIGRLFAIQYETFFALFFVKTIILCTQTKRIE